MSQYLQPRRPKALPPFPAQLDLARCAAGRDATAQRVLAEDYLRTSAAQATLDAETFAAHRPGAADELLTDREYAGRCLAALGARDGRPAAGSETLGYTVFAGYSVMNRHVLRSGLFTQGAAGELTVLKAPEVRVVRSAALDDGHLDALLGVLSYSTGRYDPDLGEVVRFAPHAMLRRLGMSQNSAAMRKLYGWLTALQGTLVAVIEREHARFAQAPLLGELRGALDARGELQGAAPWQVVVPAAVFRGLIARGVFAAIRLDARRALTSPFAKWLHAFVSSQRPGVELVFDVDELARTGGLALANPAEARRRVRETLRALERGEVEFRGTVRRFRPVVASFSMPATGGQVRIVRAEPGPAGEPEHASQTVQES